ncbi:MAG TPA: aminotransferase class V-fold PLP-dependent enzyme [Bacillota bacterium]|nr:aminotransferase class V-fold PLP-dependent enzyme [Bacillota bacterium]
MIYLDQAATSHPKPEPVEEAVCEAMRQGGSPGRGSHRLALAAARRVFAARESLAALLGVSDSSRLIFTASATDALNAAIHGSLAAGGEVLCSGYEHNAVVRPLAAWARRTGGRVRVIGGSPMDLAALGRAICPETRLVVLTHASNVSGEILPVREAAEICRPVPVLVDAAQTAGHLSVAWEELGAAAVAASGHKGLLGPQGTGLLYLAPGFAPEPVRQGGTGGNSEEDVQPAMCPDRYESGTLNTPGIAGLGAAAEVLAARGLRAERAHELALTARLLAGLTGLRGVNVLGSLDPERRVGVVSFTVAGWDAGAFGQQLDERFGVLVRTGLHCAPLAHRTLGSFPGGAVRMSVGHATRADDVDAALEAVGWLAAREEAAICASS